MKLSSFMAISLLLLLFPLKVVAGQYFKECGTYEVIGAWACEHPRCTLTVYPKSNSETVLEFIKPPTYLYSLDTATIKAKIQVTQNTPSIVGSMVKNKTALRSLPNPTATAIRFIQKEACKK